MYAQYSLCPEVIPNYEEGSKLDPKKHKTGAQRDGKCLDGSPSTAQCLARRSVENGREIGRHFSFGPVDVEVNLYLLSSENTDRQ
jgi:hypothetical protein